MWQARCPSVPAQAKILTAQKPNTLKSNRPKRICDLSFKSSSGQLEHIIFGPCVQGAVFEIRFFEKPSFGYQDGYLTIGPTSWHFHLCVGPHKGSDTGPTPPELAATRRCSRAAFFRDLDRAGRQSSWGFRMWNGKDERLLPFFPPILARSREIRLCGDTGLETTRPLDAPAGTLRRHPGRAAADNSGPPIRTSFPRRGPRRPPSSRLALDRPAYGRTSPSFSRGSCERSERTFAGTRREAGRAKPALEQ